MTPRTAGLRPRTPLSQAVTGAVLAAAVAVPLAASGGVEWVLGGSGSPSAVAAEAQLAGLPTGAFRADQAAAREEQVRADSDARIAAAQAAAQQAAQQAAAADAAQRAAAEQAAAQQAAAARAAELAAAQQRASRSSSGDPRSIARSILAARGQAGQFSCLDALWQRESGWSLTATNASSGAYGIPQALPGSKMASAGADWRTNAATQIRWGLDYIAASYGTPCAAWQHSRATGWY